ncbi:MAG: hypothetical protein WBN75_15355 [Verrucomicrobiia bacterium]|jgi:hypothetical protein
MMSGIEDKWIALACLVCISLPLSWLTVLMSSFTRRLNEAHRGLCFSSNNKNTEEKV